MGLAGDETSFFILTKLRIVYEYTKFMTKYILGKKIGMTTLFDDKGAALNVTLVECDSRVSQIRTADKDKYTAVQLEITKTKNQKARKEFRSDEIKFKTGDKVNVDIFQIGDVVQVSGTGKAKGFQGVVKRHGFGGAPSSHGRKHDHRKPGAIGAGFPEHVIKGKRMAGRMGGKRTTSENIKVVYIDKENSIIGLKGPVPGIPGSIVEIYCK
jgi:large subunit ribosomal protein L3